MTTVYSKLILDAIDYQLERLVPYEGKSSEIDAVAKILKSLVTDLAPVVDMEKKEIAERLRRDIEISWTLNPDTSGGAFTQEEINCSKEW